MNHCMTTITGIFALVMLIVPTAFAAPKTGTEIGASWGQSCAKETNVPKGQKCNTSPDCKSCCTLKWDSCDRKYGKYPKSRQRCWDALLTCEVVVSNPDLNTRPAKDRFRVQPGTGTQTQSQPPTQGTTRPSIRRAPSNQQLQR